MRIAKYLAQCGLGSRRGCEIFVESGLITCNGILVTDCSFCVPDDAQVRYKQRVVSPQIARMFLYHKLPGLIVSRKDDRMTIFDDLHEIDCHLVSVGRLDFLSEGLMILTNNGELAGYWEKADVTRTYSVVTQITSRDLHLSFAGHLNIEGVQYKAPKILNVTQLAHSIYNIEVALIEGKNRELRNIWQSKGWLIQKLIRLSYGKFTLGQMRSAKWIEVSPTMPRM